ncbi:hypothetical protein [Pseudooctadecabacter sp.]|uniref:hypothetical protein n=1 Tax=Pseudooctadecabacter sp. TaxID=1966338 RepID=UPI0035C7C5FA
MRWVLIYRWVVFLLAAGYCLRTIFFGSFDGFGGPFRYLTIWALFMSFFAASRMIALEEGRTTRRWDAFVATTAVVNAMVVILYWRLYFADPASVTRDGQLGDLWLELYMHALGPALQWIDATFIHRAFRKLWRTLGLLAGVIAGYVIWAELIVGPMNDSPVGSVTSGLPYPFLNNLDLAGRATFYGVNFAVAVVVLAAFASVSFAMRRLFPRPAET